MVILGIDPGSHITGYGLIRANGSHIEALKYGCIRTRSTDIASKRYAQIYEGLQEVLQEIRPDQAAVESLFFCKNVRSAIKIGEARGVALLSLGKLDIPVHEYAPRRVKQAVVGFGGAQKSQVQTMVVKLLGLKETPKPEDITDALAIAICHLHSHKNILQQLKQV